MIIITRLLHIIILLYAGVTSALSLASSSTTPIYYDSSNHLHRDLQFHPEQSARIDACLKALSSYMETSSQRLKLIDVSPTEIRTGDRPRHGNQQYYHFHEPFSQEQLSHAKRMLMAVHSKELVESLELKCQASRERRIQEGKDALGFIGYLDHDTYLTTESYNVCLRAAACWIECVHQIILDKGADFSFALTRPPGHHATRTLPNGFCTFNFAAVAALYAIQEGHCRRVSILDWDVHYGQGVADIVQEYPNIRYVSMHQVPAFPYQGEKRCVSGQYQNIMTVPVQPDSTWTCGYSELFTEHVLPFCSSGDWEPDLVIVCAGYDALGSDELASCNLTAEDYGTMTTLLRQHLGKNAKNAKIMLGLEGGYQIKDHVPGGNLAEAFVETIKALS